MFQKHVLLQFPFLACFFYLDMQQKGNENSSDVMHMQMMCRSNRHIFIHRFYTLREETIVQNRAIALAGG